MSGRPKGRARRRSGALKLLITGALLAWLCLRVDLSPTFDSLANARWTGIWVALTIYLLGFFVRAYRWNVLVRGLGATVPLTTLTAWYFVGAFFSLVLPTGYGGDAVKSAELARRIGRVGESVGTVVMDRFLGVMVLLAGGILAALAGGAMTDGRLRWTVMSMIGMFGLGATALAVLRRRGLVSPLRYAIPSGLRRHVRAPLEQLFVGLRVYDARTLFRALLASLVVNASLIVMNAVLGWSLGIEATLYHYLIFVPVVTASLLLPSLGGLGVREATYVVLFGSVGVPGQQALALGILVYAISVAAGLIGGAIYALQGAREAVPVVASSVVVDGSTNS